MAATTNIYPRIDLLLPLETHEQDYLMTKALFCWSNLMLSADFLQLIDATSLPRRGLFFLDHADVLTQKSLNRQRKCHNHKAFAEHTGGWTDPGYILYRSEAHQRGEELKADIKVSK